MKRCLSEKSQKTTFTSLRATRLNEQAAVDGLTWHVIAFVARISRHKFYANSTAAFSNVGFLYRYVAVVLILLCPAKVLSK